MDTQLLHVGAEALKKAALNEEAKNFVLQHEPLYKALKRAANRYLGGETLTEAVASIRELNCAGYSVTTDFMGESIRNEADAREAAAEFVRFAKAIKTEGINSSVSLDLSHIGLLVSNELALENLGLICQTAAEANQEVILSMEGTDRTDQILNVYQAALPQCPNLGITVQAYLHRTREDFQHLLQLPGSIRLVKGAYSTPAGLSLVRGSELDDIYLQYAEQLLAADHPCAIASHDEKIHRETVKLIDRYQPTHYVLERLLGISNLELREFQEQGYQCRIYLVYGKEWYLYLCNRWAEYPLNLFRGLADIIG